MYACSKRYPLVSLGKILLFVLAGMLLFLIRMLDLLLVMQIFGDMGLQAGSHLPSGIEFRVSRFSVEPVAPLFWRHVLRFDRLDLGGVWHSHVGLPTLEPAS